MGWGGEESDVSYVIAHHVINVQTFEYLQNQKTYLLQKGSNLSDLMSPAVIMSLASLAHCVTLQNAHRGQVGWGEFGHPLFSHPLVLLFRLMVNIVNHRFPVVKQSHSGMANWVDKGVGH